MMLFHNLSFRQQCALKQLLVRGVPSRVLQLIALCFLAGLGGDFQCALGLAEFFAGQCAVTNGFLYYGIAAEAYEYKFDNVCNDIMSRAGFAYALGMVLRLEPGAAVWFGIVCSTWVWMCRGSTGRSEINVLGTDMGDVRKANQMVSRVCLLYTVAIAKGIAAFLEQPVTSLMHLYSRFQDMLLDLARQAL